MNTLTDILGAKWREFAINEYDVNSNCQLLYTLYENAILNNTIHKFNQKMCGVIDENKKCKIAWNNYLQNINDDKKIYNKIINTGIIHDHRFIKSSNQQIYELTKYFKFGDDLINELNNYVDFEFIKYKDNA